MKVIAAVTIVLALLIAIVPQFTDCASQGRSLTLENGRTVPMKCHWTARAELAIASPILIVGLLQFLSKRREGLRNLGLLGVALGAFVVMLPTLLVGVCGNPAMLCNSFMRPFLILTGSLVGALNIGAVFLATRKEAGQWVYSA